MDDTTWHEYMQLENELEAQTIEYFSSMSEDDFLEWIVDVTNDPDSRSSMMVAVIREGIRFRRGNE